MSTQTATAKVNVSIVPAQGSTAEELGIFNITVLPIKPTDQILNLQYIVSVEGQQQNDFVAFVYVGTLSPGLGFGPQFPSQFYASCEAVMANRQGKSLTVQVTGGLNSQSNPFSVSQTFTHVLWPNGTCD